MDILERIRQRAAANPQHIVLPEGNDPRTVVAAAQCARKRIARITLLGDEELIRENARSQGVDLGGVSVIDHRRAPDFEKMAAFFHELRKAKGLMADEARTMVSDPLYYGNLMVRLGSADGSVAGAAKTNFCTIRSPPPRLRPLAGVLIYFHFFPVSSPHHCVWPRGGDSIAPFRVGVEAAGGADSR